MDRKVSVTVNQPGTPKGAQVEVPGLGLFQNGVPRSITDEDMVTFEAVHLSAQPLPPVDLAESSDEGEAAYQTERGQTLARAFAASSLISVEEEDTEPIAAPYDDSGSKSKSKRTVKSSAPVGEDKGTDSKKSEEE